ncbi:TonB-dependent receptor [Sphingobium sp. CAP-1]|uniref:TonB-dependent receptor n=1 Tax=Sphingobium sp. CAP-1 TaxID=2676077 RepID=UPI0018AD2A88|nr:TonB-dependent receptor [Sphingobium sp. CAP-1]
MMRISEPWRLNGWLLAGVSLLSVSSNAHGQQVPQNAAATQTDAQSLDIVVTAARTTQTLRDVPMSVNVATGEQLLKYNLFDIKDISRLAPGLELTNTNGRNNTTTLRGITFDPDQGTGPSVQVYMNEAPVDPQYAYTAMYDIQQIEVLRGAQGLLRGLSAPAGAITITTARPSFSEITGYAQSSVTNRSGYNVQGGVSLPFSDTLAIRVAALVDGNRGNNVYNITRDERSRSRTESARFTLGWQPSPDFTAYLTYQYLHADNRTNQQVFGTGNAPNSVAPFTVATIAGVGPVVVLVPSGDTRRSGPALGLEDYEGVAQGRNRFQNNFHFINLTTDWNLGGATLSFVGSHQYARLTQERDTDFGNALLDSNSPSFGVIPNKVDSAELRLASNNPLGFTWGVGAFYTKRTGTTEISQDGTSYGAAAPLSAGLFLPSKVQITVPVNSETSSFSGNLGYRSERLSVTGGLRYTLFRGKQRADIVASSSGGQVVVPAGGGTYLVIPVGPFSQNIVGIPPELQRNDNEALTGGATISYKITPEFSAYASYGHSYRQGSSGVGAPAGISNDLIRTNPEKSDSFEIGVKGSSFNRRVNFTLAAFYQKFDGYLSRFTSIAYNCANDVNNTCGGAGSLPVNNATDVPATNGTFDINYNGDATVKGVEWTVDTRPTSNWDFSAQLSYSKARYNGARVPCNDFNGDGRPDATGTPHITGTGNVSYCITNGRLANTPDFNATANTEVRFPLETVTPFISGLISYRPPVTDVTNTRFPSRTNINAYIGVRGNEKRWEVNGYVRNLLNQKRVVEISQGNLLVNTYDSGYRSVLLTAPREFGATLKYNW